MKDIFKLLVLCAITVWTVTGCGGSSAGMKQQQDQADSLLNVTYRANEYKRLETLADSLQEAGLISDVKACYWLGYSNDKMMHKRLVEFYWTTGMASYIPDYDKDDTEVYAVKLIMQATGETTIENMNRDAELSFTSKTKAMIKSLTGSESSDDNGSTNGGGSNGGNSGSNSGSDNGGNSGGGSNSSGDNGGNSGDNGDDGGDSDTPGED